MARSPFKASQDKKKEDPIQKPGLSYSKTWIHRSVIPGRQEAGRKTEV
jgi:hypothetical protein